MGAKLDAMPPSESKFWKDSDTFKVEMKKPPKCEHEWQRKKSNEVECIKCHAGLFLSPIDELKDKHIYRNGKLVI